MGEEGLHIARGLYLPAESVTGTFGLLAVRGAGKSNAARVMAEEMFGAKLPFVAIDPVGSWWGLRSSRDGKSPGLPIPIFGGRHADVPLERGAGEVLADLVVEKRLSCLLDLSQFESENDKKAFLLAFARRLYTRNEDPLHLFLEEADDYIPQKPMRDEAILLRTWENIVRRGRSRGLGITLVTQRSAAINKMVLTQVETLITLRTTSPQDRAAVEAWIHYHAQSREIVESLPALEDGEAWIWSPHFLGKTVKVRFRLSDTFDSGATPRNVKTGEHRAPATMADIDLPALKERMAAAIEKARAEDPRELRKRIARLEAELSKRGAPDPQALQRAQEEGRRRGHEEAAREQAQKAAVLQERLAAISADFSRALAELKNGGSPALRAPEASPRPIPQRRPVLQVASDPEGGRLAPGERRILGACAQYPRGATREQLTVLTGYKRSSRDTYLQRLQARGLVVIGPTITATAEGVASLGPEHDPLPQGSELRAYWLQRLPEGERRIFEALVSAYPATISRDSLEEATGYKRSSRDTYVQRLRSRQLLEVVGRGELRASGELFE